MMMLSFKVSNMFRAFFFMAYIANIAVVAYDAIWPINYTSLGTDMMGYMTLPGFVQAMDDSTDDVTLAMGDNLPTVVILPVRCVDCC